MTMSFPAGGYRFVPGVFQYSGGAAAEPGFAIERVRFHRPVPLAEGFKRIEDYITAAGRPMTAFCACELRSPAPFTDQGFIDFNRQYVGTLERWGLFKDEVNPVARSNVCPEIDPPAEPSFYAFSFTRPAEGVAPSFVIAGSGEAREGNAPYSEKTVRYGDTSPAAMVEKARHVHGEMERRMSALGVSWADCTATQIYTVQDIYPFFAEDIVRRGAAAAGLTWHYCRPPVIGLEYEMDCRAVATERVIA
ncbi:MAG: hypothetical protein ACK4QW_05720 [Alphaproteobacteria bacterium]